MSVKQLLRGFLHRLLPFAGKLEIEHYGYRVLLDPKDHCGREIYIKYLWRRRWAHEPYEQSVVTQILKCFDGCWFVDVGASYGMYPLLAAEPSLSPHVNRIIAIEGSPQTYAWLNRTVEANQLEQQVKTLNSAISDADDKDLLFFRHPKFSEWSRIAEQAENTSEQSTIVKSKTLDSLLAQDGWQPSVPLFIKVDIEGGEPRALAGLRSSLLKAKEYFVIVEFHVELLDGISGGAIEFADQILALNPPYIYEISEAGKCLTPIPDRNAFQALVERCRSGTELWQIMTNIVFGTKRL